ncbi:MAG: hypothetical protein JXL97_14485, partial [Bacteroidales bacterium]|nr:hypothetical protein [Bacteroidales bacterium]
EQMPSRHKVPMESDQSHQKLNTPKWGVFFNFNILKKIIIHIKKLLLFMIEYWEDIPVIKRRDILCQK